MCRSLELLAAMEEIERVRRFKNGVVATPRAPACDQGHRAVSNLTGVEVPISKDFYVGPGRSGYFELNSDATFLSIVMEIVNVPEDDTRLGLRVDFAENEGLIRGGECVGAVRHQFRSSSDLGAWYRRSPDDVRGIMPGQSDRYAPGIFEAIVPCPLGAKRIDWRGRSRATTRQRSSGAMSNNTQSLRIFP